MFRNSFADQVARVRNTIESAMGKPAEISRLNLKLLDSYDLDRLKASIKMNVVIEDHSGSFVYANILYHEQFKAGRERSVEDLLEIIRLYRRSYPHLSNMEGVIPIRLRTLALDKHVAIRSAAELALIDIAFHRYEKTKDLSLLKKIENQICDHEKEYLSTLIVFRGKLQFEYKRALEETLPLPEQPEDNEFFKDIVHRISYDKAVELLKVREPGQAIIIPTEEGVPFNRYFLNIVYKTSPDNIEASLIPLFKGKAKPQHVRALTYLNFTGACLSEILVETSLMAYPRRSSELPETFVQRVLSQLPKWSASVKKYSIIRPALTHELKQDRCESIEPIIEVVRKYIASQLITDEPINEALRKYIVSQLVAGTDEFTRNARNIYLANPYDPATINLLMRTGMHLPSSQVHNNHSLFSQPQPVPTQPVADLKSEPEEEISVVFHGC